MHLPGPTDRVTQSKRTETKTTEVPTEFDLQTGHGSSSFHQGWENIRGVLPKSIAGTVVQSAGETNSKMYYLMTLI